MSLCLCIFWTIVAFLVLLKLYIKHISRMYIGKERLSNKVVVITGANTGIGYICAKDFANRGAKVIMVCRDMQKAESAKEAIIRDTGNFQITLKHVDFTSLTSVRKCANELIKEEKKIDILLNNAGAAELGPIVTEDGLDALMQVNYFAPFLFTNILLGKMKQSAPSRIVNVSSIMHWIASLDLTKLKFPKHNNRVIYANSKLALIMFSNELAAKLKGTGVTVNSLHPGAFPSEILRNRNFLLRFIWNYVLGLLFRSTEEGAQTSIYACVSPKLSNVTGCYFDNCGQGRTSWKAKDQEFAKKLWTLTEEAVSLRPNEQHF